MCILYKNQKGTTIAVPMDYFLAIIMNEPKKMKCLSNTL